MNTNLIVAQRKGGAVMALRYRQAALQSYYANPNLCKHCGKIIPVPDGVKVTAIRVKTFCNSSCAGIYNNTLRRKPGSTRPVIVRALKPRYCKRCNTALQPSKLYKVICPSCRDLIKSKLGSRTKGDLFTNRGSWQSARTAIRRHAAKIFLATGKPKVCDQCGYDKHVEICHRKSVSIFPDSATVNEINDPANLFALCPNHHWEHDNIKIAEAGIEPA